MNAVTLTLHKQVSELLTSLDFVFDTKDLIVPSQKSHNCHYQCNVAFSLAKQARKPPRVIAEQIVDNLKLDEYCSLIEIAGAGFINFTLKDEYLIKLATQMATDERLCLTKTNQSEKIIVDFSGPNLAKEMHVGHLRSTIIGDVVARFFEFEGHEVKRVNHVGDWGTQFGMLIEYLLETKQDEIANDSINIASLEEFYRKAKKRFDEDEDFATKARLNVVKLQQKDEDILKYWKIFCSLSLEHCQQIYDELDISIENYGESFYNDFLPVIIKDLKEANLLEESQGARAVFLDDYFDKEGNKVPVIVQKSDGGYIYATTDLAALKYRMQDLKADKVIYITDARQSQHFKQIFTIGEKMKWLQKGQGIHLGFGMMLGADNKPFKTREGNTVKLKDLLQEAEKRAYDLGKELSPLLTEEELQNVAKQSGQGGIKYADLKHHIATDYKFEWDKMLANDGNTAFYILITYARTRSLGRKLDIDCFDYLQNPKFTIVEEQERNLLLRIISLLEVWPACVQEMAPNYLIQYLYQLSRDFGSFWNSCPVSSQKDQAIKDSRIALSGLVAKILQWGMDLLGIKVLDKV